MRTRPALERSARAVLLTSLLAATACGGVTATGNVLHAPRVPALEYPRIAVVSGHLEHEIEAARILADKLGENDSRVWLLRMSDLEEGASPVPPGPGTAVVVVTGNVDQRLETHASGGPVACAIGSFLTALFSRGQLGVDCSGTSLVGHHPASSGKLALLLWDGETGRITHREVVGVEGRGTNEPEMRLAMGYELGPLLVRLVAVQVEQVDVELRRVPHPDAARALGAIEAGDWHRGRALLQQARHSAHELSSEQLADLLYDLAQAHRFAPSGPPAHAVDRARAALREALDLRDDALYREALEALEDHREVVMEAQAFERARRRRFAGGR